MAKRILIVDDEPDIVVIMKFTLENHGFEVMTAYDGEDGLSKAKSYKPDLIILDVLMPKMLGDEVAKQLKALPDCGSIPIIFLTNIPGDYLGAHREGIQSDFSAISTTRLYLQKSCSEEELLSAVDNVFTG